MYVRSGIRLDRWHEPLFERSSRCKEQIYYLCKLPHGCDAYYILHFVHPILEVIQNYHRLYLILWLQDYNPGKLPNYNSYLQEILSICLIKRHLIIPNAFDAQIFFFEVQIYNYIEQIPNT